MKRWLFYFDELLNGDSQKHGVNKEGKGGNEGITENVNLKQEYPKLVSNSKTMKVEGAVQ